MSHRRLLPGLALVAAVALGCQSDQPFRMFGYDLGNSALYDPGIRTVYVPVFRNRAFQTTPNRGLEVDITRAVVREIHAKTPYKVVQDPEKADTELLGVLAVIDKTVLNRNQQNLPREGEVVISVDLVWRDLRDGRILTNPRVVPSPGIPPGFNPADPLAPPPPPFDPTVTPSPPVAAAATPAPVRVVLSGRFLPEVGESTSTAAKRAVDQLATQVVSMMERPWGDGR